MSVAALRGNALATPVPVMARASRAVLNLPFDALRAQYACAVCAGLIERSLLGAAHFERGLAALERLSYGPFARSV